MNTSPVDQIKERLSVADVVGSYVKLERAGGNFKARCPFHNEKTPSFFVSPSRGTYHCFGCNKGGDIFSFVEEIEGVQFTDALKLLAERAGVELKFVDQKQKGEYDKLYALMDSATRYFSERLGENNEALLYLKKRGLTDETIKSWRLGYAGEGWSGLLDYLRKAGYSDVDIEKTGFIVKGNRGFYDRFRSRIMFPLSNVSGKIVGFSGRIFMPYDKAKENELAKYVNSPDTVLYNKSRVLYGYDRAKASMLRENTAVLVEGQMDLLMSHQSGTTNAIALSGTALTEDHLKMIKRFADTLVLALDSDEAGEKASERAWQLAVSLGIEVKIAAMPKGMDPADYAFSNPAGFKDAVKGSKHIILFIIENLRAQNLGEREFKLAVSKRVLPYVAEIGNKIDQAHFVSMISKEILVKEDYVWDELSKIKRSVGSERTAELKNVKPPSAFRKDIILRKAAGIILWQKGEKGGLIDVSDAEKEYGTLQARYNLPELSSIKDSSSLIFESEMSYAGHDHLNRELDELLRNLEREILEENFSATMLELAQAEKMGEKEKVAEILKRCQELSKQINEIKTKSFQ